MMLISTLVFLCCIPSNCRTHFQTSHILLYSPPFPEMCTSVFSWCTCSLSWTRKARLRLLQLPLVWGTGVEILFTSSFLSHWTPCTGLFPKVTSLCGSVPIGSPITKIPLPLRVFSSFVSPWVHHFGVQVRHPKVLSKWPFTHPSSGYLAATTDEACDVHKASR